LRNLSCEGFYKPKFIDLKLSHEIRDNCLKFDFKGSLKKNKRIRIKEIKSEQRNKKRTDWTKTDFGFAACSD